jgi:hypothetical protein
MNELNMTELEEEREALLKELAYNNRDDSITNYKPGTFGCHELLDRTAVLMRFLEDSVVTHPACLQNSRWFRLAREASTALYELYQEVGAAHLPD